MSEPNSPVSTPFGSATSTNVHFAGPETAALTAMLRSGGGGSGGNPDADTEGDALSPSVWPSASAASSSSSSSGSLRDLGDEAVWSLSTAKAGNGVAQLRDPDVSGASFWQSDGTLPHVITLQFHRKTRVACVALYLDCKQDESYTPAKMCIRVGSGAAASAAASAADLLSGVASASDASSSEVRELERFEIEQPQGWIVCNLRQPAEESAWEGENAKQHESVSTHNYLSRNGTVSGCDRITSSLTAICSCPSFMCYSYVRCHFVQLVVLQSFQNGRDTRIRHLRVFGPRSWSNQRGALNDLTTMTSVEFRQHAQIR